MRENWLMFRRKRPTVDTIYSPDVAAKLKDVYHEIADYEDEDLVTLCGKISRRVENNFGFRTVDGRFRLDIDVSYDGIDYGRLFPHTWCVDKEERIVDLTLRQFNPALKRSVPKGLLIVDLRDTLRRRYHEYKMMGKL